jgi:N6-L-threonylcarbamoyladenine synthase
MRPVTVLGLESSCDETAAAIVSSEGKVAADVVHSQVAIHAPYGGVVPEIASRDHLRAMGPVVREALSRANMTLSDLDAIAVTNRPGLIGALLVGVQLAKGLAWAADKPIVGVDHLVGHLLSPFLDRGLTPVAAGVSQRLTKFPYIALLASGGHTAIYRVDGPLPHQIHELGATRDDAAGEAFDKVAKLLGLGYPGGPVIDRLAKNGDPSRVALVRPMAHKKTFEFSFSGLKTQIAEIVSKNRPETEQEIADLCASFQATATLVLVDKLVAAARVEGVDTIVLTGGVAANRELRMRAAASASAFKLNLIVPPFASCTDNAAMIAYAGAQRFLAGERDALDLNATSNTVLPRKTVRGAGPRP